MHIRLAVYALRIGIAFSLLYPPFAALSDPFSWTSYFPAFILNLPLEEIVLLHIFGVVEVALALWILSGWRAYIPAVISAVLLLTIVLFNIPQFPILFRDISIAGAAVALAFLEHKRITSSPGPLREQPSYQTMTE